MLATVAHARGILDTSTVIELARIGDAEPLPAEPLITAVTLAELSRSSPAMSPSAPPGRPTSKG
jgi:hypothetical protein